MRPRNEIPRRLAQTWLWQHGHGKDKPKKYHNIPTEVDGWRFDSKREAEYYQSLKALKAMGDISYFLCQVPFRLPGKIKYLCDFMVRYPDRVEWIDVKGVLTAVSKNKIRQVEDLYGIKIRLV